MLVALFPYDSVYFKAVSAPEALGGGDPDFHTITSILKHRLPKVLRSSLGAFPYDYVYFKALSPESPQPVGR